MINTNVSITYVGHATLLVEINGLRILTDPILVKRVSGFLRRRHAAATTLAQDVDVVLISHLHRDHLDWPSLRLIDSKTRVIAPVGAATYLRQRGFRYVDELAVAEVLPLGEVTIEATPATHAGFRPPFGPTAECLGFLIHGKQRIYFAGDTDLHPEMQNLGNPLDVALLPVWGWGPTLGSGHMDPRRAAEALTLLQPRLAIPIHWGTLHPLGMGWLRPRFLTAPPRLFADHARQVAPQVQVHIVQPGDAFHLEPGGV